ncbi:MAG: hypothetical protein ACU0B4_05270, partial [Paracoccus sp. (in: a-proteobacteria)]
MKKTAFLVILAGLVGAALWLLRDQDLGVDALRGHLAGFAELRQSRPLALAVAFLVAYVAVTALSLPLAVWMTLAAG